MGSYERKDEVDERNARYVADTKDRTANPEKTSGREKHVTKRRLLLLLPVILVLSSYTGQVLYNTYGPGTCNLLPGQKPNSPPPTRVGLVDTLAYDYPDHDFQQISTAAHDHGQGFDYYTPSSLSLNTFVHLPTDGYSMLIFRTHIAYSTSS